MSQKTKPSFYSKLIKNINVYVDLNIKLTTNEINYINNLNLHYPELCEKINKIIEDITDDGQIDFDDIPKIVLLLSEIYKSHIVEHEIEKINILNLIQFTMDTLLDSEFVLLPEDEIKICKSLVNTSIHLLNTNVEIKEFEKECCNCLHHLR